MLRQTLGELFEAVRGEARLSSNSSRGIDHANHIKQVIRSEYQRLAEEYDWPHLRLRRGDSKKTLAAGQRYYDFPVELNVQKIESAWVYWGSSWSRLTYSIGNEHYSSLDPDKDQRAEPATNWEWYSNADLTQFEVWPLPASNTQIVSFEGQRKVQLLTDDTKRCDIDGLTVALHAAAIVCTDKMLKQQLADRAAARMIEVASNSRLVRQRCIIGGIDPNMGPARFSRRIRYVRASS